MPEPQPNPQPVPQPVPPTPPTPPPSPAPEPEKSLLNQAPPEPEKKSLLNELPVSAPEGAPEKYEAFTAPDGYELDPGVVTEASTIFKEMGLTQKEAQQLVDFYAKKNLEAANAPVEFYKEMQDKWVAEIKADPEIGGKLDQVKTTVARAIDSLGDPKLANDFRAAMDMTGAGNNPAFIKAFYKLAQRVVEPSTPVSGSPRGTTGTPTSAASRLYPSLPSAGG